LASASIIGVCIFSQAAAPINMNPSNSNVSCSIMRIHHVLYQSSVPLPCRTDCWKSLQP
jgi:hypothetical protein